MKLSLRVSRNRRAFTLIELLVAASVTVIVLSSLCGVYISIIKEWHRQDGEGDVLVTTSRACDEMAKELSEAVSVDVVTTPGGNPAIKYTLPADEEGGVYVPIWSGGKLTYSPGVKKIFYLSDSTGHIDHSGNILWRGIMTGWGWMSSVTRDSSWDTNAQRGRIAPLDSLEASVDDALKPSVITVTVTSSYKLSESIKTVTRCRTIYLRNRS